MKKNKFKLENIKQFLDPKDIEGLDMNSEVLRKKFHANLKIAHDDERMVIGDVTVKVGDEDGDLIMPDGADFKSRYEKNPLVVWNHDYSRLPLGKTVGISVKDERIQFKMHFADTEFAQEVFHLIKGGFLKAFSIGFIIKGALYKGTDEFAKFVRENKLTTLAKNVRRIITDYVVIENSVVPLGCNPLALATAVSNKSLVLSDKTLKELKIEIEVIKELEEVEAKVISDDEPETEVENVEEEKDIKDNTEEIEKKEVSRIVEEAIQEEAIEVRAKEIEKEIAEMKKSENPENSEDNKEIQDATGHLELFEEKEIDLDFYLQTEAMEKIEKDIKPFPTEHSFRLRNPAKYDEFRRRNNMFAKGVHGIFGIFTKDGKRISELQSIRIDSSAFTFDAAKVWIKEHDFKPILSEAATGKKPKKSLDDMPLTDIEVEIETLQETIRDLRNETLVQIEIKDVIRKGEPDLIEEIHRYSLKKKGKIV